MQSTLFYGSACALATPFKGSRIDYEALEKLIDWQISSGTDALVVLGTTGEPSTITPSERSAILECAVARCNHRVPLIAGSGSNNTAEAIRLALEAQLLGADGLLIVTPYYNRTSRSGLIAHYTAIADRVELPIIMYNVPGRTGMNLPPETVAELAKHPNLCAVKEASGNLKQMTDLAAACGEGVAIYCGNDDQVVPAMALGARGVISVAANIIPEVMHDMVSLWLDGHVRESLNLQLQYLPLIRVLFKEVNPIPVKSALSLMGRCENTLRLPLCPLDDDPLKALRRVMKQAGLVE